MTTETWACIKITETLNGVQKGTVANIIVCDIDNIDAILTAFHWEDAVRYDNTPLPHPHIGCKVTIVDNHDGTKQYEFTRYSEYEAKRADTGVIVIVKEAEFQMKQEVNFDMGEVLSTVLTPKSELPPTELFPVPEKPIDTIPEVDPPQ